MAEPLLLSVSEASKRLGLGEHTVRALIRSKRLASVAVGTRNRKVPAQALQDYIARETEGGSK